MDPATSNGTYNFGYIDESRYTGDIGYASIMGSGSLWMVQFSGLQLANGTFTSFDDWNVTMDTGTGGSTIPRNVAEAYFAQVDGSIFDKGRSTFIFPCSSKLVDFTFGIGDFRGTIPADALQTGAVDDGDMCLSKIHVAGGGSSAPIWGQSFIEQLFVVFDWGNARVGFAKKRSNTSPTSTSSPTASTSPTTSPSKGAGSRLKVGDFLTSACIFAVFLL